MKKAIITGITGQDGSYLAELLLEKGYEVYGFIRRESFEKLHDRKSNISHIKDKIKIIPISISDPLSLYIEISKIKPDEFYHLAAQSFVSYDMSDEINIFNINFNSTVYIISSIRQSCPKCKFFFAGSSEMFGEPNISPQDENTYFNPKSIYGISKVSSFYLIKNAREKDKIFAVTGIMYNHESVRRASHFVTKKIISTAIKIKKGEEKFLELGNLDAQRDWGFAPDYVRAMWLILQQDKAEDFVISTGNLHTVRQFVDIVFTKLGLDYNKYVKINQNFFRPSEKIPLCGNSTKLKSIGWKESLNFEEIIEELIKNNN